MMPLMYAILKDARADLEEASRRIDEGRGAEALLDLCLKLRDKFQLSWKMISLVNVILRYTSEDQENAFRKIDEAFFELRALAAVEAARYTYTTIPPLSYGSQSFPPSLYPSIYAPICLPSLSAYSGVLLSTSIHNGPPPHSPTAAPPRPRSRA